MFAPHYRIFTNHPDRWWWILMNDNEHTLSASSEIFQSRGDCLASIHIVQSIERAPIIDDDGGGLGRD